MSSLTLWSRRDPFAEFDALVQRVFAPKTLAGTDSDNLPPTPEHNLQRRVGFVPAAEVTRDGDDALVRLELPGLDATKDVTVEVDRGQLVIRGERRDERTEQEDGRTLREVRYGSFRWSFTLPAHVTAEAISASYDAGVLTVRVAGAHKRDEAQRIAITAS